MKTLEPLLLHLLRPQVGHALNPLQLAHREKVGVGRCHLLSATHLHTICQPPLLLRDKLKLMRVDTNLATWITGETTVCQTRELLL